VKCCHEKAYLLDSPSHLRMLVKTQVVAGMFSPIAKVSVAKRHCTQTHRICNGQLKDRHDGQVCGDKSEYQCSSPWRMSECSSLQILLSQARSWHCTSLHIKLRLPAVHMWSAGCCGAVQCHSSVWSESWHFGFLDVSFTHSKKDSYAARPCAF